jgi:predicted DNA-binding transcriptional regulator AlpA
MSSDFAARALSATGVAHVLPELMTADDVAHVLRVSRRTVFRLRQRGDLPRPVELGRGVVRWRTSEIAAYVEGLKERPAHRVE